VVYKRLRERAARQSASALSTAMHCSSLSTAHGQPRAPNASRQSAPRLKAWESARTVSSSLVSRLTSLYGLLTGDAFNDACHRLQTPRSTELCFPLMPMAVRKRPGMGCAFSPGFQSVRTRANLRFVACDCLTISMNYLRGWGNVSLLELHCGANGIASFPNRHGPPVKIDFDDYVE